jgi:hypothetical protein
MDPPAPPQPGPLDYAKPDLSGTEVQRRADVVRIRVAPLGPGEHVLRLAGWSFLLASTGTSAAMRAIDLRPRVGEFLTAFTGLIPLPIAALLAPLCAYKVFRIARRGRDTGTISVDAAGIVVDHPTRLRSRTHISYERFVAVKFGSERRDEMPHMPWHLVLLLRDGPPVLVPMPQTDQALVAEALRSAVAEFCPLRGGGGGGDAESLAPPDRGSPLAVEPCPPRAPWRISTDGAIHRFADGVRILLAPTPGWIMLHIVCTGFLIWLTFMLADYTVARGGIPVHAFAEWTFAYAALLVVLYVLPSAVRDADRERKCVVDALGDSLVLSDADFHGQRRRWGRDEIRAIEIGGWLNWLTRVGLLRVRLVDGTSVTLLYGYPLPLLRVIARELRASLHLEHHD